MTEGTTENDENISEMFLNMFLFISTSNDIFAINNADINPAIVFEAIIKRLFNNIFLSASTVAKITAENSRAGQVFIILLHFQLTGSTEIIRCYVRACLSVVHTSESAVMAYGKINRNPLTNIDETGGR